MPLFGRKKKSPPVDPEEIIQGASSLKAVPPRPSQPIELGSIHYVNLTPDGRHGDIELALTKAKETGKPIFCNFVEWSG